MHKSLYVTDNLGKNLSHKICSTFTGRDSSPGGQSRSGKFAIRITSVRISGVLLCTVVLHYLHSGKFIYDSKS